LDRCSLNLSGERTKNKRSHVVPLAPTALALLDRWPRSGEMVFKFAACGMRVTLKGCHLVPPRRPVALALRLPVAYSSHHVVRGAQQWLALGNQGSNVHLSKLPSALWCSRTAAGQLRLRDAERSRGGKAMQTVVAKVKVVTTYALA